MNRPHKHEKIILKLLSEDDRIEYCLTEGRLSPDILLEAGAKGVTEQDVKQVAASIKKTEAEIATVLKAIQDANIALLGEYFTSVNASIKKINKMIAEVGITGIADNPSVAQSLLSYGIATEDSVTKFTLSLSKGLSLFSENLTSVIPDDQKDKKITELDLKDADKSDETLSTEKIEGGLVKALEKSGLKGKEEKGGGWIAGLMKIGKSIWKRMTGEGGEVDAEEEEQKKAAKIAAAVKSMGDKAPKTPTAAELAKEIMGLSINQINKLIESIKSAKVTPPKPGTLKQLTAKIKATPVPAPESDQAGPAKGQTAKGKVSIKQVRSELENAAKEAGVPDPGKSIDALIKNDALKAIFTESSSSSSSNSQLHRQRLSSLLFEAETPDEKAPPIKFDQIRDAIKSTASDKADVAAAKIISVLKAKGANVDDKSVPDDVKKAAEKKESEGEGEGKEEEKKTDEKFVKPKKDEFSTGIQKAIQEFLGKDESVKELMKKSPENSKMIQKLAQEFVEALNKWSAEKNAGAEYMSLEETLSRTSRISNVLYRDFLFETVKYEDILKIAASTSSGSAEGVKDSTLLKKMAAAVVTYMKDTLKMDVEAPPDIKDDEKKSEEGSAKASRKDWTRLAPTEKDIDKAQRGNKGRLKKVDDFAAYVNKLAGQNVLESKETQTILTERWARLAGIKDEN